MAELDSFQGLRTLVLGLGRFGGGVGVTRWLAQHGAIITVSDQANRASLAKSLDAIADLPVALKLGGNDVADLDDIDLVVVNPAVVKARSAFFQEMGRRCIPWTTEINLFCERCPAKMIGVTGSFGKSTTCAMLAMAIRACLSKNFTPPPAVHLGGNIGHSLLPALPQISSNDLVILELSSAQLEDLPRIQWVPSVGVITNLCTHHTDRYADPIEYFRAKFNISRRGEFSREDEVQTIVAGDVERLAEPSLAEVAARRCCHVVRVKEAQSPIDLRAPGGHNQKNAATALTVCELLGLDSTIARAALREFRGLPHRLELVATSAGVDFINDSKSTSPSATVAAIDSHDGQIVAIVGGQRKEVSWERCAVKLRASCRAVVCFGEAAPDIARAVQTQRDGVIPTVQEIANLPEAVRVARALARNGDAVLFSPGTPSFDTYANFTERGDHFRELVSGLSGLA